MNTLHTANSSAATLVLHVAGMSCDACVRHVTRALEGLSGVQDVRVDLHSGRVVVKHEHTEPDLQDALQAISQAGYSARLDSGLQQDGQVSEPYGQTGGCCRRLRRTSAGRDQ